MMTCVTSARNDHYKTGHCCHDYQLQAQKWATRCYIGWLEARLEPKLPVEARAEAESAARPVLRRAAGHTVVLCRLEVFEVAQVRGHHFLAWRHLGRRQRCVLVVDQQIWRRGSISRHACHWIVLGGETPRVRLHFGLGEALGVSEAPRRPHSRAFGVWRAEHCLVNGRVGVARRQLRGRSSPNFKCNGLFLVFI